MFSLETPRCCSCFNAFVKMGFSDLYTMNNLSGLFYTYAFFLMLIMQIMIFYTSLRTCYHGNKQ